jgi:TrAA12-like
VRFAPVGLLILEKVTMVVAHCPAPRFPNNFGMGSPVVVGVVSVASVNLALIAVTELTFWTVTPTMMSPQLVRTNGVTDTAIRAGEGDGVGVGEGVGVGLGVGVGDGLGDGLGDGDGDGDGDGVGVGPPGWSSNAPASVPSLPFAIFVSS